MVGLGVSLSLAGFGNPTHGWPMSETPPLVAAGQRDGYRLWQLSPAPTPPFLIEVSLNEPASTYWGLWLAGSAGAEQQLLVDPQGFISCGPQVDWRPFIHAHAGANRLSLQVEPDGQLVWRVNDEIAWAGQEMLPSRIGIAVPTDHALDDIEVTFYERP